MIPHNRLLGSSISLLPENQGVEVDVGSIFRRLLLFDTYILKSVRLKEIPEIVRIIGFEETIQLLSSPAFKIHCNAQSTGQTGQLTILKSRERKGALPKGSYCFQSISVPSQNEYISNCFRESIDPMPYSIKQQKKLKRAIVNALETPPDSIGTATIEQLKQDLLQENPALTTAVKKELKRQVNIDVDVSQLKEIGRASCRERV